MTMAYRELVTEGHRTCVICGHGGLLSEVRPSLARLAKPGPTGPFARLVRCKDITACRVRCEANGDPWPLVDGRMLTTWEERPR